MALRNSAVWICAVAVLAVAGIGSAVAAGVETPWIEIKPAVMSGRFKVFDLIVPKDYRLCGSPVDFPPSNGDVIPVDPSVGCGSFDQDHPGDFPDSLTILDWADTAMRYNTVQDVAQEVCAKMDRRRAGKTMGGQDTIICTQDLGGGHTLKMALAYYRGPDNGSKSASPWTITPKTRKRPRRCLRRRWPQ